MVLPMKTYTKKQEKLVYLLEKKGLTLKQASIVLKTTPRSVERLYHRIKEKGVWKDTDQNSKNGRGGLPPYSTDHFGVRLHNIQWHITPSYLSERYHVRRMKGQSFRFGDCSLVLQAKNFEIYSSQDFWGVNADECMRKALEFFWGWFPEVERLLGVVFVKDKSTGVRLVRSHYAEVGNELAQDVKARKDRLKFVGSDSKVWLEVDASLGVPELEAVHAVSSREDMNKVKPFFDDLRKQEQPILLSEVMLLLDRQAKVNLETAQGLLSMVRVLNPKVSDVEDRVQAVQDKPAYVG